MAHDTIIIGEISTRLASVRIAFEVNGITHYLSADGDGSLTPIERDALVTSYEWAQGFIAGGNHDDAEIIPVD